MTPVNSNPTIEPVHQRHTSQLGELPAAERPAAPIGVLVFALGAERYAIDLSLLSEVLPRECTAMSGSPHVLLGVINIRGVIQPVVDLRRLLDLTPGMMESGYVLMLRDQDRQVGIRVDSVEDVRQVDPARLTTADGRVIAGTRFVKALTADTVILLDAREALAQLGIKSIGDC